jgi:hypothetical protein
MPSRVFLLSSGSIEQQARPSAGISSSIRDARRMSAVSLCEPSKLQSKHETLVLHDNDNVISDSGSF